MKALYLKDRKQWRAWLEKNGQRAPDIWLIYPKKDSGKVRIPYDDAVEEALCFGWIDGTTGKLDANRYVQRFTPRRHQSLVSDQYKEGAKADRSRKDDCDRS